MENPVLMERLHDELDDVTVVRIDEYGIPAAAKEAYLFALLGCLTVHQLPANVPTATGASRPVMLGCVVPGAHGFPSFGDGAVAPRRLVVVER